mmetsp:Transcript_64825/g.180436  ORF Transcript_64825/g.180436 Transcript_64825/m.180436 type:complete len:233 (-) Transcript_64825:1384-2082(-)
MPSRTVANTPQYRGTGSRCRKQLGLPAPCTATQASRTASLSWYNFSRRCKRSALSAISICWSMKWMRAFRSWRDSGHSQDTPSGGCATGGHQTSSCSRAAAALVAVLALSSSTASSNAFLAGSSGLSSPPAFSFSSSTSSFFSSSLSFSLSSSLSSSLCSSLCSSLSSSSLSSSVRVGDASALSAARRKSASMRATSSSRATKSIRRSARTCSSSCCERRRNRPLLLDTRCW